jgi:hypothetical protein
VTVSQAKEFDATIRNGGAAEFVAIEGSLEITAVADRLDKSKIDAWWDR